VLAFWQRRSRLLSVLAVETSFGKKYYSTSVTTKDGVFAAKEIELEVLFDNMGAQMVRQVAARASEVAGDGTATATVLVESLLNEGLKAVVPVTNPMDIKRGIDKAIDAAVEELKTLAIPCEDRTAIVHVGTLSIILVWICAISSLRQWIGLARRE